VKLRTDCLLLQTNSLFITYIIADITNKIKIKLIKMLLMKFV